MTGCFLGQVYGCGESEKVLTSVGADRITTIINSSKHRQDNIHVDLEKRRQNDETLTIQCHRDCISTYTSSWHISRHLKRSGTTPSSSQRPVKRTRRSDVEKFEFRENCLYCGENCALKPDPKNPKRWRKALLCRTADRPGRQTFKETVLEACESRNDDWAKQVEVRLLGAVSDLHAADARYHDDCRKIFMNPRSVEYASREHSDKIDHAFEATVNEMKSDTRQVWTSVGIHTFYAAHGGTMLSRINLFKQISEVFGEDLLVFSSPGLANVIVFRSTASDLLRLEQLDEDNMQIESVAKQIVKECKQIVNKQNIYNVQIDKEIATEESSSTLLSLLSCLSDKLEFTLPALLIANMVTGILTHKPTSLQIALGVQTRERSKIDSLHDFGVTCTYDEVKRFKASAAMAAAQDVNKKSRAINDSTVGLIQAVADNFDANISSQNCLRSTHALALLLTQDQKTVDTPKRSRETIERVKKEDMKPPVTSNIPVQHFQGPKKPEMPANKALRSVLPLKMLAEQVITSTLGI